MKAKRAYRADGVVPSGCHTTISGSLDPQFGSAELS